MKYCPNPRCPGRLSPRRPAEFVDDAYVCSDCGTPLLAVPAPRVNPDPDAPPPAADAHPEPTNPWEVAESGLTPIEGQIARSILEAEGIEAELEGMESSAPFPDLASMWRHVRLFVHHEDVERARAILAEADAEAEKTPPAADE